MTDYTDDRNYPQYIEKEFIFKVAKGQSPERIDHYLTKYIFNATRNRVQKAIDDEKVTVNGRIIKASKKVQPNDEIVCKMMKAPPIELVPEDIPLDIVFEDDYLLVVNKPADMCTHPGFGHRYGTLVNAILYHFGLRKSIELEIDDEFEDDNEQDDIDSNNLADIFSSDAIRPGIVHRLDKDTSGLLVIAKNPFVHSKLSEQFAARTTKREYVAIVWGEMKEDEGTIEGDIGRSSRDRKLYAIVKKGGKYAKTDYWTLERYKFASLVKLKLHTGRTHQIRVHLSSVNHTVFGDPAYGGDKILYHGLPKINKVASRCLNMVNRQLLHAKTIGFIHPITKQEMIFESDLPEDFKNVIKTINNELILE